MLKSNKQVFKLKPFIANEFFYDFDSDKYNKNWLSVGFDFPKTKFGKFSTYYRHMTDLEIDNNWVSSYNIVAELSYEF